jgi:Ohr subfamily peroxiredoxin
MSTTTHTGAKLLFTGKSHTISGPNGSTRSADGFVDFKLPEPHPAAEKFFASAWGACYLGALDLALSQRKIKPTSPPSIDVQIDLSRDNTGFFLKGSLNVTIPGVDRKVAEELAEAAHGICPYSKAVHGNIEVTTTVA